MASRTGPLDWLRKAIEKNTDEEAWSMAAASGFRDSAGSVCGEKQKWTAGFSGDSTRCHLVASEFLAYVAGSVKASSNTSSKSCAGPGAVKTRALLAWM